MISEPKNILCVTANPCVDRVVWYRDSIDRPTRIFRQLGGKGVNAARMLSWLGHRVVSVTFGKRREQELAAREPGRTVVVPVATAIREVPLYLDRARNEARMDYVNTNRVTPREARAMLETYRRELERGQDLVMISGSACAGAEALYPAMVRMAKEKGIPVMLDSYGQPLLSSLPEKPDFIKPNREELEQAVGTIPPGGEAEAAGKLLEQGAGCVLLTMGSQGSWCVTKKEKFFCPVFPVETVSAIGSGDAFAAYFAHAWLRGWSPERCLEVGSAAGAANAMQSVSGRVREKAVTRILRREGRQGMRR